MGRARQHLYYKCEIGNKNRRESNAEVRFRKTLSFLLLMSGILCFAKSDIALAGSDIVPLRLTVIFYSP